MANQLITKEFGIDAVGKFINDIDAGVPYFVFTSKHTSYQANTDQTIIAPIDSIKDGIVDVYSNMIFGKKIRSDDVHFAVPKYEWALGEVYDMFDDRESELSTKRFYVSVNVGSFTNVYKCLYNNGGQESTVEPSGTDTLPFETPSDGYIWKYMYTIPDHKMKKFATSKYIPVIENTNITDAAVYGSIDVIAVDDTGLGYDNYLIDEFRSSSDIRIGGNPYLYALGERASSAVGFYRNCLIKMTSGQAKGEYSKIVDYYISGGQKIISIETPFSGNVAATDTFEIYPYVSVYDTGGSMQTNCIARAIVSGSSNAIQKIDVLDTGSGYRSAIASVLYDAAVPVSSNATVRAVMPPPGGHGSDVFGELYANQLLVSVKFIEDETPFTIENDFRSVGVLKAPKFESTTIKIDEANTVGEFATNERVFSYKPVKLAGVVDVISGNTTVLGINTYFESSIANGDFVIISDTLSTKFAQVDSVTADTVLNLTSAPNFTSTDCEITFVNDLTAIGYVSGRSIGELTLSNVNSYDITSKNLIGEDSSCKSEVDQSLADNEQILINGRSFDNFDKFLQLSKLSGSLTSGMFSEDEIIVQDNGDPIEIPTARFHSLVDSGATEDLYITDAVFSFKTSSEGSGLVTGTTSNASFIIDNKYNGDLVKDSGQILYIENLSPISRNNNQTETLKLLIKFA